ncbi:MAG: DUF386 domain-containing protein [Spirochaetaceae bacterium]|nr:MAG: DUF386 domain-containing protein [Spirochaetaceae bacterium]
MVIDRIDNASLYGGIGSRIAKGLAFLAQDHGEFRDRTVEIDGRDVYAMFQSITTEGESGRFYEAHRDYIDIQYIASGEETIRVVDVEALTETTPYDPQRDVAFYALGPGTDLRLHAGDFAILYPHEAHLPKLPSGTPAPVQKIVIKVRVA